MALYFSDFDEEKIAFVNPWDKESAKEKFLIVRSSRPCKNKYLNLTFM